VPVRISPAQQPRRNIPVLTGLRDDRNRFPIVSGYDSEQSRVAIRVKRHPFADLEVEHF